MAKYVGGYVLLGFGIVIISISELLFCESSLFSFLIFLTILFFDDFDC